jgi:pyrophosphatase PpaX
MIRPESHRRQLRSRRVFATVLFDLDGTVVDSANIILASMRHATSTVLGRTYADELLVAGVGGPGLEAQMTGLDANAAEELVRIYRIHNAELHTGLECFGGMLKLLDRLSANGRQLGLVTAKPRATVDLAFAVLPLERYFDVIVTSDDTERLKPHPDPILKAVELAEAEPTKTAYVGDSPFDICAAKAARVGAIAVTWGKIHSADALRAEEPDALVDDPEELYGVL